MSTETELFAINASNHTAENNNRWVVYGSELNNCYEVYLATTKDNKIAKVHTASCTTKDQAIALIVKMDQLCTPPKQFHNLATLAYYQYFAQPDFKQNMAAELC